MYRVVMLLSPFSLSKRTTNNNSSRFSHRRIKRLVRPGLGFGSLRTARRTLAGYEAMAMIRKGQARNIDRHDIRAQTAFVAGIFKIPA